MQRERLLSRHVMEAKNLDGVHRRICIRARKISLGIRVFCDGLAFLRKVLEEQVFGRLLATVRVPLPQHAFRVGDLER